MGKRQVKTTGWSKLALGVAVSIMTYLLGICLIAFLMVKGILMPEKNDVILTVWVTVAAACGSLPAIRMKAVPPLLACMMQGGIFAIMILAASYLFWEGAVWSKANVILMLCAMVGAFVPGVIGSGEGKRKKKRRW